MFGKVWLVFIFNSGTFIVTSGLEPMCLQQLHLDCQVGPSCSVWSPLMIPPGCLSWHMPIFTRGELAGLLSRNKAWASIQGVRRKKEAGGLKAHYVDAYLISLSIFNRAPWDVWYFWTWCCCGSLCVYVSMFSSEESLSYSGDIEDLVSPWYKLLNIPLAWSPALTPAFRDTGYLQFQSP